MYEVTVEAGFSSGHYLRNYKGKCENPHGHNYKVRVTLMGTELDATGLLLDFKLLKQVMRPIIDRIDHQMLNDLEPFTELNPSAENLAKYFYDETNVQLAGSTEVRLRVPAAELDLWTEAIALLPNIALKPALAAGEGMRLGDCVIETGLGSVDLGIRAQLGEIERGFFDRAGSHRSVPAAAPDKTMSAVLEAGS